MKKITAPIFVIMLTLAGVALAAADAVFGDETSPNYVELAPVQEGAPAASWRLEYDSTFDEEWTTLGFDYIPDEHHKWGLQFERDPCLPAGCGAGSWRQAEAHFGEFISADGETTRRAMSATVRLDTYFTKILFNGQTNFLDETATHNIAQIYWGGVPVVEVAAGGYLSLRQGGVITMRDSGDVLRSISHLDSNVTVFKAGRSEGVEIRNSNWQVALHADNNSTEIKAPNGTTWNVETFQVSTGSCEERLAAIEQGLIDLGLAE